MRKPRLRSVKKGQFMLLNYILRRSAYSFLVIIGVLLLTFVLFRFAAGDPTEILLGKNPSPIEIEQIRSELSCDKPVLWGKWRRTEVFRSADFAEKRDVNGIKLEGSYEFKDGALSLSAGKVVFTRNFPLDKTIVKAEITYKGSLKAGNESFTSDDFNNAEIELSTIPEQFVLESAGSSFELEKVQFFRSHSPAWDSQLLASIKEIVTFTGDVPYMSFLNFGKTLVTREEIRQVLWRGMWPSLYLMLPIFFGELIVGISLALVSTAWRGQWPDKLIMLFSVAGMSISYLVFIIFGQWYLGYYFNIFPVWGYGSVKYLLLPVIIGILSGLGGGIRFYRTVFVNELNKEYLRTAAAKGCSDFSIYCKHLLRNAAIPLITRATTILPFLFTGSLLLESFFGIPGLGYAGINALMNSDLQMIKALVILTAFIFVVMNLVADITYAWADPRVRIE